MIEGRRRARRNLLAHPNATMQVGSSLIPVTARTATPDEKKRLWPIMTGTWPAYDKYQQKTERDIPLVVLTSR